MRARNLKPGICTNEVLGTADPLYTLLFERLWLMADREGRLEDRPLRIKAQAFPYRDGLDIDALLQWLHEHEFITRYEVSGNRFIQIRKFSEHQSPHVKEAPSTIPAPVLSGAPPVREPENPAPATLIPDSGFRIPDSGLRAPEALVLPDGFATREWEEWIAHRRKRRWPVDDVTLRKQVELLAQYSAAEQRQILATSINAGWQGVFPPKGGKQQLAPRRDEPTEWTKLKTRAKACGFRDPWPPETPAIYETALREHERDLRAAKRA